MARVIQKTTRKYPRKCVDSRKRRNPDNEVKHRMMPQEPEDEDRFYVIEKLIDKRYDKSGNEEYLVRWQNYPPQWDTWEPRGEIEKNASDMIREFNRVSRTEDTDADSDVDALHCICRRTYRFEQGGMIQCFNCLTWYHFRCLKMNMEEANSYARYNCKDCRDSNPNLKNAIKTEKLATFYGMSLSQQQQ